MATPTLFIEAVSFWAPQLPSWDVASAAFRGEHALVEPPLRRPAPALLAPIQRRRAPDTVVLALEVAARAVAQAGLQATQMPSVFVSAHGDLIITDDMCQTLAEAPTQMSPTRFHNSVHNAASGYWTMATGCMQASTALTAFDRSFAAGVLEAATQCAADQCPVLLVGYDIEARGALKSVTHSRGLLAAALVLAPRRSERSVASLGWSLKAGPSVAGTLRSEAARSLAHNAMVDAVPLLELLASRKPETLLMPLSAQLSLVVEMVPL